MKWLVCIDVLGVTCQLKVGNHIPAMSKHLKSLTKNRLYIMYIFEREESPIEKTQYGEYEKKDFITWSKHKKRETAATYDADSASAPGYDMRKRSLGSDYIEVLANLSATDYSNFNYPGQDGAIEILLSAEKVMSSCNGKPGDLIMKWIKKLQLEKE